MSFDAWLLHPQIPELADLADAFPQTSIVLDHVGGCVGKGHYADDRKAAFAHWRKNILELGKRPNVRIKLGGVGMPMFGFGWETQPLPPSSGELASAWRPYVETCIEAFGHKRCMFESNFPVDKVSCSYGILWNAFKRIAQGASASEKAALFHDTAAKTYRL
jgi:predicted TIM-barrel fold metal-dependent hydrolase